MMNIKDDLGDKESHMPTFLVLEYSRIPLVIESEVIVLIPNAFIAQNSGNSSERRILSSLNF